MARVDDTLDHHLILSTPQPLYVGELPGTWDSIPAPVVVNLCGVYPRGDPGGRLVFGLPLLDVLDRSMSPSRETVERFLAEVHVEVQHAPSYWHCHAGINRSNLAAAAYLHLYLGHRISDAIALLRERRSEMVLCNHRFEGLLREWYGGPDEQAFKRFDVGAYLREREGRRAIEP
jgi:protein-tyrosine phosphatase